MRLQLLVDDPPLMSNTIFGEAVLPKHRSATMSTTQQHAMIDLEDNTQCPADAVRRMAAQLMQLAEDLDAGTAVPLSGAGMIARLPHESRWSLDLEMEFMLREKPAH